MKSAQQSDRPNVLLVVMDDTRADHLSCYGYRRQTTPRIDQLADQGVLYEQCISPAIWTLESMSSLMTGLYSSQHGTSFQHQHLEPQFMTLSEVFQGQGYQTSLFSPGGWISKTFGFERGFQTFQNTMYDSKKAGRLRKGLVWAQRFLVGGRRGKMTYEVLELLHHWFEHDRQPDRPFFTVAHFVDPHWPWFYHPQFSWRNGHGQRPRVFAPDHNKYTAGEISLSTEKLEMTADYYDGEISFLDHSIGGMLDRLQAGGHLDNTLVILTADHGEHLGEHGLMGHKMSVYDDLLRVPLVLYHPEFFAGGQRVCEAVQTIDVFSTLLELLNLDRAWISNNLLGRSLQPDIVNAHPRQFTFSEFLSPNMRRFRNVSSQINVAHFDRRLRTVRMRDSGYKFIWASDGRHELYNLKQDPGEIQDLAGREPEKVLALQAQLDQWLAQMGNTQFEPLEPELEEVVADRLRSLGYLE